jgi:hypothetical protein
LLLRFKKKERQREKKELMNESYKIREKRLRYLFITHFPRLVTVLFCFVQDPKDVTIFRELYLKLMTADQDNFPATTLSGLQRACNIKYAFIATLESVVPLLKDLNCSVVPLPYQTYPISLAMAFSPNSPYTDFWNYRRVSICIHPLDIRLKLSDMSLKIFTLLAVIASLYNIIEIDVSRNHSVVGSNY